METKDMLLGFAARIDQILQELEATAGNRDIALFTSHEMMVAHNILKTGSRYLVKTAARYE